MLRWLMSPSSRFSILTLIILGLVVGVTGTVFTLVTVEATGSNAFCLNCHEMQTVYDEYTKSSHYTNSSGVNAACADCHLPHHYPEKLIVKTLRLAEVWYHLRGTINSVQKFEDKRSTLAASVWKELAQNDAAPCRACHDAQRMNQAEQSQHARKAHARARRTARVCIDCHIGLAHNLPPMTQLPEAQAAGDDAPVVCNGCHADFSLALADNHPAVSEPVLKKCFVCHVPGIGARAKNSYFVFLHASHKQRLSCVACHEANALQGMKLRGYSPPAP